MARSNFRRREPLAVATDAHAKRRGHRHAKRLDGDPSSTQWRRRSESVTAATAGASAETAAARRGKAAAWPPPLAAVSAPRVLCSRGVVTPTHRAARILRAPQTMSAGTRPRVTRPVCARSVCTSRASGGVSDGTRTHDRLDHKRRGVGRE